MSDTKFTEKQKGRVLLKKGKTALKNILANPFPKYWPLLPEKDRPSLEKIFQSLFNNDSQDPLAASPSINNRKKLLSEKYVTFGLSSVVRNLKNATAYAVLLSASIEPKFVTRQIITMGFDRNPNIKVLCVENLEEIIKKYFNFSCLAVALLWQNEENSYGELYNFITEQTKQFPVPDYIFLTKKQVDTNVVEEPKRKIQKNMEHDKIDFNEFYLIRESANRKFIPNSTIQGTSQTDLKKTTDIQMVWSDFISFSNSSKIESDSDSYDEVAALENRLGNIISKSKEIPIVKNEHAQQEIVKKQDKEIKVIELNKEELKMKPIPDQHINITNHRLESILQTSIIINKKKKKNKNAKKKMQLISQKKYIPLKVNKIQGNPKKIKKKKKSKNKK